MSDKLKTLIIEILNPDPNIRPTYNESIDYLNEKYMIEKINDIPEVPPFYSKTFRGIEKRIYKKKCINIYIE